MNLGSSRDTPMQSFLSRCLSSRGLPSAVTGPGLLFSYTSEPNRWSFFSHKLKSNFSRHQLDDLQFNSSLTQTTNFSIDLKGEGAQCHSDCTQYKIPTFPSPHLSCINLLELLTELGKILLFTFTASL